MAEARRGRGARAARGQRAADGTFEAGAEEGASAEGGWGRASASYIRAGRVLLPAVWGPAQGAGVPVDGRPKPQKSGRGRFGGLTSTWRPLGARRSAPAAVRSPSHRGALEAPSEASLPLTRRARGGSPTPEIRSTHDPVSADSHDQQHVPDGAGRTPIFTIGRSARGCSPQLDPYLPIGRRSAGSSSGALGLRIATFFQWRLFGVPRRQSGSARPSRRTRRWPEKAKPSIVDERGLLEGWQPLRLQCATMAREWILKSST